MPDIMKDKFFLKYLLKFGLCFCILYFGTLAIIGLSAPGGYYSEFVHNYLDYVSLFRFCLLHTSKILLMLFGYNVFVENAYIIRMHGGSGVHLVYSCLGFGVMSFWVAFVYANTAPWKKKAKWIIGGVLAIIFINVLRISIFLVAINKHWHNIFNLDNHALFNIAVYMLIFVMIYMFDRNSRKIKGMQKPNNGE
jgi:exosortase/archaeosortase family protein